MNKSKKKFNEEYQKNFNKKCYLCMHVNGKVIYIYEGNLKSILKYTTYCDSEKELIEKLNYNLNSESGICFKSFKCKLTMRFNKNGPDYDVKYKNDEKLLFLTSMDIYKKLLKANLTLSRNEVYSAPDLKIELYSFMCSLIDKNYKEEIKKSRESHNATTALDVIRTMAGKSRNNVACLNHASFETIIGYERDVLITLLNYICKDYLKKQDLLNELSKYIDLSIDEKVMKDRREELKDCIQIENVGDNRKDFENQIKSNLIEADLAYYFNKSKNAVGQFYSERQEEIRRKKFEEQLREYEEETTDFEKYLLQEGIPINDFGIPMYDSEYDLPKKK